MKSEVSLHKGSSLLTSVPVRGAISCEAKVRQPRNRLATLAQVADISMGGGE